MTPSTATLAITTRITTALLFPFAFTTASGDAVVAESPETLTFSKRGKPPPLFAIASKSDCIVRTFTSEGGGGGAGAADAGVNGDEVNLLLPVPVSICIYFNME